jgi:precorrin-6B methylase 2
VETSTQQQELNPSKIMEVGLGFMSSKTLLTAANLGLFTILSDGGLSGKEIADKLGLNGRGLYDFLDTLVALGFLTRKGIKDSAVYGNSPEADLFLDRNKPTYMGGILQMCNNRIYRFCGDLEEALKTGKPQNEVKTGEQPVFEMLYSDPDRMREFIMAMAGIQMANFAKFAREFDFSRYQTHSDVGGAGAHLSVQIALNNPHIRSKSFDLPVVMPIAAEVVESFGVSDRVELVEGDFFKDPLPESDVITMGNILHDWGTNDKRVLIGKAFDALPEGGSLVIIENIIDDDRRKNAFGMLMSLNMLIETEEGYDFSGADFDELAREAGFKDTRVMPLTGPASAAIAVK